MSSGELEFRLKIREILSRVVCITSFAVVILDFIRVITVTTIIHSGFHIPKNISAADVVTALAIIMPLVTFVHHLTR